MDKYFILIIHLVHIILSNIIIKKMPKRIAKSLLQIQQKQVMLIQT